MTRRIKNVIRAKGKEGEREGGGRVHEEVEEKERRQGVRKEGGGVNA